MIEYAVEFAQVLPPVGILAFAFAIAFLENIFPPSPSDMLLVFCGTLAGIGAVNAPLLVLAGSIGGSTGFLVMYWLGKRYGNDIFRSKWLRFIPRSSLTKAESWFKRSGYWIILGNRFLSGTRAVISLFAGMSGLHLMRTLALSSIGSIVWNSLLVTGGYLLGDNWRELDGYLSLYGRVVGIGLLVLLAGWLLFRHWRTKRGK